ncbi:hypothetical protein Nepgr_004953 [Nepenthes gracilis]|uniref:Tetratricopeptide repeat protein 27 homolog n=1 Tax=Nepenthes gracilis TaxID=150966 RepID=A0AAD3S2T2_NEPGR|nr:hypothetical protein Nepgr_004953 [Nepenthes gracilis]
MVETERKLFREYELRLLRCSLPSDTRPSHYLPPSSPSSNKFDPFIDAVIRSIESGQYREVLSSDASRAVFKFADSVDANQFYAEVERSVESFLTCTGDDDALPKVILVVSIAIAALLAFVQCNMTGPIIELPPVPLHWEAIEGGVEWEAWAKHQLMSVGSELLGKFTNLQYIVFAKLLLMKTKDMLFGGITVDGVQSISWWLVRVLLLQQRMLSEHCSSLYDLLQVFKAESLLHFENLEKVASYWNDMVDEEEGLAIVSMLHLEAGLMEHAFGHVDSARKHFESAELAAGLKLSVTGVLGFRTIHQVEPKAQMMLVANRRSSNSFVASSLVSTSPQKEASSVQENLHENVHETSGTSDVLMTPRFLEDIGNNVHGMSVIQNGHAGSATLKAIQQAVVLAQCVIIEKSAVQEELQRWDIAPYIEAIDSQQSSSFAIRSFCDILRIRWESTRSRTKERSLLMMDKLVQGLFETYPEVIQRIRSCFGLYIPMVPALRKEYGELLVSHGLIGEAVKIFEELELWDNLIYCYRLLEKKAAAVELIKTQLCEMPNDPRLWCSLGDVTSNDACYQKALEVSNNRSARAKRSLARSAYNRGDYESSRILWESAMALNSLYPDGWFALGAAALKARDIEKALDGFTRAVQLDPENGEAWNNIACLHMIKKKSKEAVIAFKEALKFKRNSWQLWENYSHVATDVGNFAQAVDAIQMVHHSDSQASFEDAAAKTRETEHLMEVLGKILQQIVRSNTGADIWGLYARWHKIKGDLTMCSEALLKQVRSYQGSDLWKDADRFKKYACASLELCKVYTEISSSTGSSRVLQAAEMHLHNAVKQADIFSNTEEYKALQVCLDDVRMRRQANSVRTT